MMSGDFKGARENFNNYISKSKSKTDKAKAHYNIGNSYLTQYAKETKEGGQPPSEYLESAVNEYKKSLRHNPKDSDARYNLSYALKMMQNQQNKDQEKKTKITKIKTKITKTKIKKTKITKTKIKKTKITKTKITKTKIRKTKITRTKKRKTKITRTKKRKSKIKKNQKRTKRKPNESKEQAIKNLDAINGDEEKSCLRLIAKRKSKKKSKTKDW